MATTGKGPGRAATVFALLLGVATAAAAGDKAPVAKSGATAGDKALRDKVLALNSVNGNGPMAGKLLELLKDPAGTRPVLGEARKVVKEAGQPLNLNATFILARAAYALRDFDDAVAFYKVNADQALKLQSGSKVFAAYEGLTAALSRTRDYEACEKYCREFQGLEIDDTLERAKPTLRRRGVLALALLGRYDKALEAVEEDLKNNPENFFNLEVKAQILRQSGKFEEALKVYEETLEKIKNEKRITDEKMREGFLDDVRYSLSGVYTDLDQVDKATAELEGLLKKHPDNAGYNNDLGYIWADRGIKLEESEKMIRRALESDRKQRLKDKEDPDLLPGEDKDNPAYLDSLGWVLFKQKKYNEAKEQLAKAAAEEDGKHVEIYDHLAQVHQALGQKAEAVAVWKKALQIPAIGKRDQDRKVEIEKKLKANQ